jgi:hypothetical protein
MRFVKKAFFIFIFVYRAYSGENSDYLTFAELNKILHQQIDNTYDIILNDSKWGPVNSFRDIVKPVLNQALSEIIEKNYFNNGVIIEIGAGHNYNIKNELDNKIIRIQPDEHDFQFLTIKKITNIYNCDVENLVRKIKSYDINKKVPLIWALNVFDCMSCDERNKNIDYICSIQKIGDKLLLIHDANPELHKILQEIKNDFKADLIFPFFESSDQRDYNYSMKVVILPYGACNIQKNLDINSFIRLIDKEIQLRMHSKGYKIFYDIYNWQKENNAKIICLEDYYKEKMIKLLNEKGYETKAYYYNSFTVQNFKELQIESQVIKQPLIYKAVTDMKGSVRQWDLNDNNLIQNLALKGLSIPEKYNAEFVDELNKNNNKLIGAELLVIECTKVS